jgi:tetrathionate reductase subunit B
MDNDRRNFLKHAGRTVISSGLLISVFPLLSDQARASGKHKLLYAYIVDTEKCIGCGKCVDACAKENSVPKDSYRTWIERYTINANGKVTVDSPHGGSLGFNPVSLELKPEKSFFVPKLCNHCKDPNCVQVCPVGATYVSEDGFVLMDEKHCVGCGYCVQACPYGARFMNHETETADKCTWCYHRVKQGGDPTCVIVCPVGARQFGKLDDPDSMVSKILKEKRLSILKPETGNDPMTFYIGLDKEVI